MSALLGAVGGLGRGLTSVGESLMDDSLTIERNRIIEEMRAKRDDTVYARNRADFKSDAQAAAIAADEANRIKRERDMQDFKEKEQWKRDNPMPEKPRYEVDADGNMLMVNGKQAEPVVRKRTEVELNEAQTSANRQLQDTVNQGEPPRGILAREMNRGKMTPAGNSPEQMQSFREGLDQRGWFDVKAKPVSDSVPVKKYSSAKEARLGELNQYANSLLKEYESLAESYMLTPQQEQRKQQLERELSQVNQARQSLAGDRMPTGQQGMPAKDPLGLGL